MRLPGKILIALLLLAASLGTLVALRPLAVINALTPEGSYRKTADVAYGNDPRQRLDIYTPAAPAGANPAAVVVFFYGGNWNSGKRADYAFVGQALAARGIVAVIADYRLYPQVRYPSFLEDGARAVSWTSDNVQRFGGDPKRLFLMGHSAGAYNAAMIALDRRWLAAARATPASVRGWIGLAGPYDFIPIKNPETRPVFFYPDTPPDSQPINHVGASSPPALLMAPAVDPLVDPRRNTGGLAERLRAAGVATQESYFDNLSHASLIAALWWPLHSRSRVLDQVERFVFSDGGRSPIRH